MADINQFLVGIKTKHLSYELHDGKELDLMISGNKPLAMFYEDADIEPSDSYIPEEEFDRLVDQGVACKGEYVVEGAVHPKTGRRIRTRYVLYARQDEQWRIPAMILVLKTMRRTSRGPDEGLDRMIGSLLGYTNDQNDEYISMGHYGP